MKNLFLKYIFGFALIILTTISSQAYANKKAHTLTIINLTPKTIDVYLNQTKILTAKPYSTPYTTVANGKYLLYSAIGNKMIEKMELLINTEKDGEHAQYFYNIGGIHSFAIWNVNSFYKGKSLLGALVNSTMNQDFQRVATYNKQKLFVFNKLGLVMGPKNKLPQSKTAFIDVYKMLPILPSWKDDETIQRESYKYITSNFLP